MQEKNKKILLNVLDILLLVVYTKSNKGGRKMKLNMKQARKFKDISQQAIADQMGMHVQTYRKLEQHPEQITIEQAIRFCKLTGFFFDEIFLNDNLL